MNPIRLSKRIGEWDFYLINIKQNENEEKIFVVFCYRMFASIVRTKPQTGMGCLSGTDIICTYGKER
jgi:hypothetical protein